MQPCAPLPRARDGRLQSLISNHIATAQAYHACAETHDNLVAVVRTMQRNAPPENSGGNATESGDSWQGDDDQ